MYSLLINHLLASWNQNDIYTLKFCSFLAFIFDVLSTCCRLNCAPPEVLEVLIPRTHECDLIFKQVLYSWSESAMTMWRYWENILYKSRSSWSYALPVDSFTSWATREAQVLEWVAYPFSRGSTQPRNWTGVFCIASRFFTNWAIRKAPHNYQRLGKAWCRILSNSSQEEPTLPTLLFKTSKSSLKNY